MLIIRCSRAGNPPHLGNIADLQTLIISCGRELTVNEYRTLLATSGFTSGRVIATLTPVRIIEGIRE